VGVIQVTELRPVRREEKSAGEHQQTPNITTGIAEFGTPEFEACWKFEVEHFGSAFGLSPDEMVENYKPYNSRSWYVNCEDASGRLIGVARMIDPTEGQTLKTYKDLIDPKMPWKAPESEIIEYFEEIGLDPNQAVDFATYKILEHETISKTASEIVMASIMAGVYHESIRRGRPSFIAAYDIKPLKKYRELGLTYKTIAGLPPRKYLGSVCEPVCNNFDEMEEDLRSANPHLWKLIVEQGWKGQERSAA
jgi:hypothetical protein